MKFAEPLWLAAGVVVCSALAVLLYQSDRKRRQVLAEWITTSMAARLAVNFSPRLRLTKRIFFVAGIACLFAALARPQAGFKWQEVKRKGTDILVAVDVSRSMLSQDLPPSRLERAKLAVRDLVSALDGDRVGLIPFAGNAYLMCPPTLDYDALSESIDELSPDLVPVGGTDIGAAIQAALKTLESSAAERKVLILMTDGEDLAGSVKDWARQAAAHGLVIYTIGIGTTGGELIPVTDPNGGTSFVKDDNGNPVKSHLDEATLRDIANSTHGDYIRLAGANGSLDSFYRETVAKMPKNELKSQMQRIPLEQYHWPLLAGLLLLAAELLLHERRKTPTKPVSPAKSKVLLLLLLLSATGTQLHAGPAESAYQKGDYEQAARLLESKLKQDPGNVVVAYNLGTAQYKAGQFDEAEHSFGGALKTEDLKLQERVFYNLGNAQYRVGEGIAKNNPAECRKSWERAVKSYECALNLDPKDADAKFNLELVKKRLKELPPKPQDKKDQKDQKDNKDQKNDSQKKPDSQKDQDKNSKPDPKSGPEQKDNQPNNPDQNSQPDKKDSPNQPKDPNGQGDDKKQQPQNNQQSGDKNNPPQNQNQQPQPGKDQKQDGSNKPQNSPDSPSGQPDKPESGSEKPAAAGLMTRREAQNLLQSMKSDDRLLPVVPMAPAGQEQDVKRNW